MKLLRHCGLSNAQVYNCPRAVPFSRGGRLPDRGGAQRPRDLCQAEVGHPQRPRPRGCAGRRVHQRDFRKVRDCAVCSRRVIMIGLIKFVSHFVFYYLHFILTFDSLVQF